MDRVKKSVHYWCSDTINRTCTGKGITAAVMDTGLAYHPDFAGRVLAFKDCVNQKTNIYDDSGHGTHVAGILAGDGKVSGGTLAGMAPEASLVVVKVLDRDGNGTMGQIEAGIRWIIENHRKYEIRIVNISMGARAGVYPDKDAKIVRLVEELWDRGLIVVVSAGNYGPGKGTISVPGTSRKVITTGAMECEGRQKECSGQGPTVDCVVKPDVVAPGYYIISTSHLYREQRKAYTVKSGSSMAAPVVAGASALVLSKYPDMRNVEMKLKLRETSRYLSGMKRDGWGCLQVEQLLK